MFTELNIHDKINRRLCSKAMRSMNIIEYSIIIRVGTIFSQKFQSNYNTIFSVFLNMSKISMFCVLQNKTKLIMKHWWLNMDVLRLKTDVLRL